MTAPVPKLPMAAKPGRSYYFRSYLGRRSGRHVVAAAVWGAIALWPGLSAANGPASSNAPPLMAPSFVNEAAIRRQLIPGSDILNEPHVQAPHGGVAVSSSSTSVAPRSISGQAQGAGPQVPLRPRSLNATPNPDKAPEAVVTLNLHGSMHP